MTMIVELVTPLMLATTPLKIDVEKPIYSHTEQKQIVAQWTPIRQITMNGTRTFDFQGRPNDADND